MRYVILSHQPASYLLPQPPCALTLIQPNQRYPYLSVMSPRYPVAFIPLLLLATTFVLVWHPPATVAGDTCGDVPSKGGGAAVSEELLDLGIKAPNVESMSDGEILSRLSDIANNDPLTHAEGIDEAPNVAAEVLSNLAKMAGMPSDMPCPCTCELEAVAREQCSKNEMEGCEPMDCPAGDGNDQKHMTCCMALDMDSLSKTAASMGVDLPEGGAGVTDVKDMSDEVKAEL